MTPRNLDVSPAQLRSLADAHAGAGESIKSWANENGNFPADLQRTHGIASMWTYLEVLDYFTEKRTAGEAFGQANMTAAESLRVSARLFEVNDRAAGQLFQGTPLLGE